MTNLISSSSSDNLIQLVHAYLDGELDLTTALSVEEKIAADPKLAAERDRIIALREAVQQNLPRDPIPPALQRRIEKTIGLRQETSGPTWRALAASVALAVLVTSSSTWVLLDSKVPQTVEDAVVAGHIRALMAPQPADVASTERHTVKPWFNGRVVEAPHVADLASDGFPLIGGRVDVVAGRPVPTLVYGRRKHIISLTAVPTAGSATSGPKVSVDTGYNIVQWVTNGISYWAVSDVSASDLGEFAKLFRATQS
ncbi:MAG TPA: anti-sigma factor [Pseudolabrys sp.]|jgi:anti-sigma factor RsiW|nr:anti-sigma factor [Pseudolabrys sp.]